jgi:hypothetical protein
VCHDLSRDSFVRTKDIGFASKVAAAEDFARKKNDPRNDTNEHESD